MNPSHVTVPEELQLSSAGVLSLNLLTLQDFLQLCYFQTWQLQFSIIMRLSQEQIHDKYPPSTSDQDVNMRVSWL